MVPYDPGNLCSRGLGKASRRVLGPSRIPTSWDVVDCSLCSADGVTGMMHFLTPDGRELSFSDENLSPASMAAPNWMSLRSTLKPMKLSIKNNTNRKYVCAHSDDASSSHHCLLSHLMATRIVPVQRPRQSSLCGLGPTTRGSLSTSTNYN